MLRRTHKPIDVACDQYIYALARESNALVHMAQDYPEDSDIHKAYIEEAYIVAYTMTEAIKGFGRLIDTRLGTVYMREEYARMAGQVKTYMDDMLERRGRADSLSRVPYEELGRVINERRRRNQAREDRRTGREEAQGGEQ